MDTAALRLRACAISPYLSSALYTMKLIVLEPLEKENEDDDNKYDLPTMGVDKYWRCYINPEFVDQIGIKQAAGVLVHEVYHLISNHAERSKNYAADHQIWNIAGDMAINQDLRSNGIELPEWVIYPQNFNQQDGELAETYYDQLIKDAIKIPGDYVAEGSGATGEEETWEKGKGDGTDGTSEAKGEMVRRQVAKDIERHPGSVPGGLARWANEHLNPIVDWQTKLSSAIRGQISKAAGMVDYTYSQRSRRSALFGDFIMPRMVKPIPDVSVLIDTSGSMNDDDLGRAMAETQSILAALGNPITVYTADTEVHTNQQVFDVSAIKMVGGGGTDMDRAINEVADAGSPWLLVVITDGWTGWPSVKPTKIDHTIAVITQPDQVRNVPEWIESIAVDS